MVKALPIPGLRADTPYGLAAAETIRVRADELVAQATGVLDTDRIERVHGMRVATRRLRAVLEIYAPCFPPAELKRTLREVKALADALGARRDPDVQLEGLDRFAATLPEADRPGIRGFMSVVRADQEAGNATLAAALERLDPQTLRDRIERLVRAAEDAVPAELRAPASADGDATMAPEEDDAATPPPEDDNATTAPEDDDATTAPEDDDAATPPEDDAGAAASPADPEGSGTAADSPSSGDGEDPALLSPPGPTGRAAEPPSSGDGEDPATAGDPAAGGRAPGTTAELRPEDGDGTARDDRRPDDAGEAA